VSPSASTTPECFDLLLLPRFAMAALAGTLEPLRLANRLGDATLYAWRLLSPEPGRVMASNGIDVRCDAVAGERLTPAPTTLLVCAGFDHERWSGRHLLDWLRRLGRAGWRCTGRDCPVFASDTRACR